MRLVIATPLYPPEIGGPATYAKSLEDGLPGKGIEVELVKFSEVRHLPNAIRHVAYCVKILRHARKADVILALDVLSVGWPVYFANLFLRKPLLVKIVGDHVWEQGTQRFSITGTLDEFPRFSWRWNPYLWFLRGLQFLVVRGARAVIVPSEYLKKIVTAWNVPLERIRVIYNAVELPETNTVRARPEGFFVVSSGRRVPWKGFEAIERVVAREPGWHFLLLQGLSREEALERIQGADVFVLNSDYEGLSHALIEAMMLGTPVIATDVGGNPELIEDGETGLIIPPKNEEALHAALRRVAEDPVAARSRAAAAKLRAQDFSVGAMLERTAALLKSL